MTEALKNNDPKVRVEAGEALKELGDPEALENLTKVLLNILKYGKNEDKVEAIALICGHGTYKFLVPALSCDDKRAKALEKVQKRIPVELVRDALIAEVANEVDNPLVRWYALLALVELGDRSSEILNVLVSSSENLMNELDEPGEESGLGFWRSLLALSIREETLRALSYFRDNPIARDAVIDALEGRFLAGRSKGELWLHHEFYALGALADPTTRERLEYWAAYKDDDVRKRARMALEFFGTSTYDEIKEKAE